MSLQNCFRLLALGCVSMGAMAAHAHAADAADQNRPADAATSPAGLGEIVVTATRRAEALSKVPLSIVATDQKALDMQGVRSAGDIMRLTPSITFGSSALFYGTGQSNIAIRGVLSTSGIPTTGIYIDDTPIQTRTGISPSLTNPYPQIFDLDRVEVLRGPQGTLFGTGSMGGAIRFITPAPVMSGSKLYARSELATTEKGAESYEAGVAGGAALIEGKLGFRASVWHRHDGGFVDRLDRYTKQVVKKDINSGNSYAARLAFGWTPTENITITPSIFFQREKLDDGAIFEPATTDRANVDYRTSYYVKPQYHTDRFVLPALKAEVDLGPVSLISNTSYFSRKTVTKSDDVALNIAIWAGYNGPFPPPDLPLVQSGTNNATSQKGITQEVRFQSSDTSGRFNWVVGAFYSRFVTRDSFDAENLGLLVLGGQQLAQRPRHGHDVQQRHAGLELGVQHDRAVDITDGAIGCAFEYLHHAGEMQHHPHDQGAGGCSHTGPAVKAVAQHNSRDAGHGNNDFLEVHGAIFAGRQPRPLRTTRSAARPGLSSWGAPLNQRNRGVRPLVGADQATAGQRAVTHRRHDSFPARLAAENLAGQ